jgi:hypothetical protein
MKKKKLLCFTLAFLLLTGCSKTPESTTTGQAWDENWLTIGTQMGVEEPSQLTLLDNKEALAADGLYYATWVAGDFVPYENSDGETIDLYDAQLYLLVSECDKEEDALTSRDSWLAVAKENYDVLSEQTITCNDQSYTVISYNCISENTPYDHGVSAFGTSGFDAVCAEFTCVEDYEGDLMSLLTEFLNGCHYSAR